VGFSVLLGLNQALVKLVNAGFAPFAQAGLRSLFAFFPVLVYALLMRKRLSYTDGSLGLGLLNGLFFALEFALLFLALDYSTVTRVSLFFYTMPLWVAVGAHFLIPGEALSKTRALGLALAVTGVAVALIQGPAQGLTADTHATSDAWIGDLLGLFAAMFWAGVALLLRTTRLAEVSPEMNLLYQLGVSAVLLTACAWLFFEPVREPTPIIWGILAFQVIFVACIGFLMWIWLLSIYPTSDMASFSLLTPLFAIAFGWLIFDDTITVLFLLALALVLCGLVLVNRRD